MTSSIKKGVVNNIFWGFRSLRWCFQSPKGRRGLLLDKMNSFPHRSLQELRDVVDLHRLFLPPRLDAVFEHGEAVGAGRGNHVRLKGKGLVHAHLIDPLSLMLLHPHPPASSTAAEAPVVGPFHLFQGY